MNVIAVARYNNYPLRQAISKACLASEALDIEPGPISPSHSNWTLKKNRHYEIVGVDLFQP
jgi:hypothetical protein